MIEAGAWGLLAESSLVLGAILSFAGWIRDQPLRLVTAFGAGVPNAYKAGDKLPGVATAAGFAVAALLSFNT